MEEEGEEEEVKKKKIVKKKKVIKRKPKSTESEEGTSTIDDPEKHASKSAVKEEKNLDKDGPGETKTDSLGKTSGDKAETKTKEEIKGAASKSKETIACAGDEVKQEKEKKVTDAVPCDKSKETLTKTDKQEEDKVNKDVLEEGDEKLESHKDGVEDALLKLGKTVSFAPISQFFKGKDSRKRSEKSDPTEAVVVKKSDLGSEKKHITAALTTVFLDNPSERSKDSLNEMYPDAETKQEISSEFPELNTNENQSSSPLNTAEEEVNKCPPKDKAGVTGKKILGAMKKMVEVPLHAIKIKSSEKMDFEEIEKTEPLQVQDGDHKDKSKTVLSPEHPSKEEHVTRGKRIFDAMKKAVDVPMHAIKVHSKDEASKIEKIEGEEASKTELTVQDDDHQSKIDAPLKDEQDSTGKKFFAAMKRMANVPMHAVKIKSKDEFTAETAERMDIDELEKAESTTIQDDKTEDTSVQPIKDGHGTTGKKFLAAMKKMVDVPMHAIKIKTKDEPHTAVIEKMEEETETEVDHLKVEDENPLTLEVDEAALKHSQKDETAGKKFFGAMKKMVEVPMHAIKIKSKEEHSIDITEKTDLDDGRNVEGQEDANVTEAFQDKPQQAEGSTSGKTFLGAMKKMVEAPMHAIKMKSKEHPQQSVENMSEEQTTTREVQEEVNVTEASLEPTHKEESSTPGKTFLGAMKKMVEVPMHAINIKSNDEQPLEKTEKTEEEQTISTDIQGEDTQVPLEPVHKDESSTTGKKFLGAMKKMVEVPMHAIKIKSKEEQPLKPTEKMEEEQTMTSDIQEKDSTQVPLEHSHKDESSTTGKKFLGAMKKMVEVPMHAIKIKSKEGHSTETTEKMESEQLESKEVEEVPPTSQTNEEVPQHDGKEETNTSGNKFLGAMKKMVEVPMHAIKFKSKDEHLDQAAMEINDEHLSPPVGEEVSSLQSKKEETGTTGKKILGAMKKMVDVPMHAINIKTKDVPSKKAEKTDEDESEKPELPEVQNEDLNPTLEKEVESVPLKHQPIEEQGGTGKRILGVMKKMVEVPMHAIKIKSTEESKVESSERVEDNVAETESSADHLETEGSEVYPLPPKNVEVVAPEVPPKEGPGKNIFGTMKKMVDVPMTAIRVKIDSISPTRKEKKEKIEKDIKDEEQDEKKVKDITGSPPLPPRNKTGPGSAKTSNKFRFWEKRKGKTDSQSPRTRAEKEIFELFSKNFFSDDPNRFSTLQPRKNIGPDGRIRESSLPPPNKLKSYDKSPKVPPKTWMWEELRRTKLKGGYPWTHLYKGSIDDAHWKEIMEHEYEYVDPRPELLRPETVTGGRLSPKGSPRVSPRATPEPERPKPQRRFIRIPNTDQVIIPLHGSSDEEHNPDRYEQPELIGQEEIGATPAKFQPTPSPSPSRRKAAVEPKLSDKLRTTAGHLGSKIRKTIPDRSKLRLPDKPKFLTDIPQIKLPETPKFLTEKPKFLTEKPKFLTEKPKFLTEKPKFLTERPKFLTEKPKFLTERPKFLTERPKFLTERPKFLKEGIKFPDSSKFKFPDRSKLTMPSLKLSKNKKSKTKRETSVKSEYGSEKNIFHSLKARTYPRFLNKRKRQGTKKSTPPPGQSKFDSESLPSTPRSKRNDKWTDVYKQKSVEEQVKVPTYVNGESFHERYSKREAKRASSSSVADSDREQGMAQDEIKVEYDVPVAPVRKARSRGTSVADEDRTSRGAESIKSEMQIDDDLNDEFQMEDDQKEKDIKESIQMETSIRMVEMTIVQSAMQEPPAYSNVSKIRPPRPPQPQKEVESGTLPRLKSKIMGHRHMQQLQTWKNQGVDFFFTYPRKAIRSMKRGPKRPIRNYSTIAGPIRPPRRRKVFREHVYEDADIEPRESIPYMDEESTGGMKGRPLPPPPRPPHPRNGYFDRDIEPMMTDEPNALKVLAGQDIADEPLPVIPISDTTTRHEDLSDRMLGRPLPPPPRRKRGSSSVERKRETTPSQETRSYNDYDGVEDEEAIDARMTIDISEPITVLSVEHIEPVKSESDLVRSEAHLPTDFAITQEPSGRKVTAEISQQTSIDIGEINVSVQTDPLPEGAIVEDSEDLPRKLIKSPESDEEPTIEKYLEKYESEIKLLARQVTPAKTVEPTSKPSPQIVSADEEYLDETEGIDTEIQEILEKEISEVTEEEIVEPAEKEIKENEETETLPNVETEVPEIKEEETSEIIEKNISEYQEKGIIESSEKEVIESLEKEIILTDEEAERNINKAETKIIEKAMPIQVEELPKDEPKEDKPSKQEEPKNAKLDDESEPIKTFEVPFTLPDRLHLTHLDVDNLNVSSLKASHILVSDLTGQSMQVAELTSRGGNLVVNGMELPPSFVQTLADEITAKVEEKIPQRPSEPVQPVVDIVQKLIDLHQQQPQQQSQPPTISQSQASTSQQGSQLEAPEAKSEADKPQQLLRDEKTPDDQTVKPNDDESSPVTLRSESPFRPQKLTVVTAPPTVVVQTAAESSQPTPETVSLSASDSIPTPRTTRNKSKKTTESTRIVDDSEDELATTMPKPTISRIIPVRPSTSKAVPSTSKPIPSTSQALQPTSASGLTARQLLVELLKIWKNCMTEGFVACSNTVGRMFPEGQKRRDAQTAACILFVIIIALFALGFGTDNTVHYHHWDFVPPR